MAWLLWWFPESYILADSVILEPPNSPSFWFIILTAALLTSKICSIILLPLSRNFIGIWFPGVNPFLWSSSCYSHWTPTGSLFVTRSKLQKMKTTDSSICLFIFEDHAYFNHRKERTLTVYGNQWENELKFLTRTIQSEVYEKCKAIGFREREVGCLLLIVLGV